MDITDNTNSRIEELDFLISILGDLAHKYKNHNTNLLEELISNLSYRKEKEEVTAVAKFRSEEYLQKKRDGIIKKNHHHIT